MKRYFYLLACFLLCGCVSIAKDTSPQEVSSALMKGMSRRFLSLRQVRIGMSKNEIRSVLGDKVVVGYETTSEVSGQYKPITVNNPYRVEQIEKHGKKYNISYYLVGIRKQDDIVADDELVPLVFLGNKLVGMGWDYFHKKIKGS